MFLRQNAVEQFYFDQARGNQPRGFVSATLMREPRGVQVPDRPLASRRRCNGRRR